MIPAVNQQAVPPSNLSLLNPNPLGGGIGASSVNLDPLAPLKRDPNTKFMKKLTWKGFSGFLQFFTKYPIWADKEWAVAINQIIWNILLFVILPGIGYGAMIANDSDAISVPDEIKEQMPGPYAQGFYFAVVTMTTLGFGDITPGTVGGQVAVMFHILGFVIFNFIYTLEFSFKTE